ncbi:DUF2790 domain-containing protein [Pseudomonas sp. Marseille-Q5115]|uniref:DUF2790 domain-containing protein n=1 Tax=Pseudomonas sp. Marseille-Q5115 TaxID=2866593 RepID=UPI001CE4116A|nr:DUF2790 domain-containing protein [Pseudomonas sp. Marseille-Q5115]
MNIKALATSLFTVALSLGAVMAHADTQTPHQSYQYGTHLDIQHVNSVTADDGPACGVTTYHMAYEDSQGQQHVLDYLGGTPGCTNQQ